ncbi:glycosyltransferase [Haloparvum sp. PAK95]|uniref:glycosyltransferase n=1 Tax=Haloparvum sp. PAK95 TaxID=3418962 RepID=UPI003D2ED87A
MEVKTVDDATFSFWRAASYTAITVALVAIVLAPTLVFDAYPRVLNTLLLVGLVGLVGRSFLSALLSFRGANTPDLELSDAELPEVSIVIPAYNEEPVLPDTIDACLNLDYPAEKLEVVLCYEAASVDRTAEICREAAANHSIFTAVERDEPGGGKAKAMNYALQFASHDLIAMIDADHRYRPDAIRRAVAWFETDDDIWCIKGRCYGTNADDSILALHATVERHIAEKADLFAREVIGGFTIFGGGQAFFRREVFDTLGEFDEDMLTEDIDMSSKIHAAGKRLVMDPSIITFEENPPTLQAWWSQRKRWARGWMQVAVRYLTSIPRNPAVSVSEKADAIYTFSYAIIPAFVVIGLPLAILPKFGVETATYVPGAWAVWTAIGLSPIVVTALVYLQDWRDGLSHQPREYLAAVTLWFYLVFQTIVFITAFIEEFIVEKPSVYVTTSRAEASSDD